jgi:signal peptidase I
MPDLAVQAATEGSPMYSPKKTNGMRRTPFSWTNFWRYWVKPVAVVIVVLLTVRSAIADWNDVPTGSMKPTILEGDRILVNKLAYDLKVPFTRWHLLQWGDPERGEIVVFPSPRDEIRLVKRIVGTPGDVLELRENRLFVNGKPASYEPLDAAVWRQLTVLDQEGHSFWVETLGRKSHPVMKSLAPLGADNFGPVLVPRGHYFVMGDNRDGSFDSRFFGFVERDRIIGRATSVVMSLDLEHHLVPRWKRFFHGLP